MIESTHGSARQQRHFEALHDKYERHYYDQTAMYYRRRYFYDPLLEGLDLNDRDVVDLACGSGHNSLELLRRYPRVRLVGIDISARACADYRVNVGATAYQADLTRITDIDAAFDFALIIGGLHHCIVDLSGAVRSVHRLLRPCGKLAMYEPSRRFFLQTVREWWYRADSHFDHQTEGALDHDELLKIAGDFDVDFVHYLGGPAWCLILNSMICRVPLWLKPRIAPGLMLAERFYNSLPGSRMFPAFVARWTKVEQVPDIERIPSVTADPELLLDGNRPLFQASTDVHGKSPGLSGKNQ